MLSAQVTATDGTASKILPWLLLLPCNTHLDKVLPHTLLLLLLRCTSTTLPSAIATAAIRAASHNIQHPGSCEQ